MSRRRPQDQVRERVRFVVRMADGPFRDRESWRGEVEHVSSREKRPFQGESQLIQVLEELATLED